MVTARTTVERTSESELPSLADLVVRTRGLEIAGPQGLLAEKPTFESRHVDLELRGKFDAPTGNTAVTVALNDNAPMIEARLSTNLDLKALVDYPSRAWSTLRAGPISGSVDVPRREVRSFASLPSVVAENLPPVSGDVALHAQLSGTVDEPRATARIEGFDLAFTEPPLPTHSGLHGRASPPASTPTRSPWALPVSLVVDAQYDGKTAVATARAAHAGKEIARVDGDLALRLATVLSGTVQPTGSLRGVLTDIPIGNVPFFSARDVGGDLGGTFAWEGIGTQEPTIKADLSISSLRTGHDATIDRGSLHVDVARPSSANLAARADARLSLRHETAGP